MWIAKTWQRSSSSQTAQHCIDRRGQSPRLFGESVYNVKMLLCPLLAQLRSNFAKNRYFTQQLDRKYYPKNHIKVGFYKLLAYQSAWIQ